MRRATAPASRSPSYLYVANNGYPGTAVDVFDRDDLRKAPVRRITNRVAYPSGIFVDPYDNLYVADGTGSGHDHVTMYNNEGKLVRIYRGLESAVDVVVGRDGTVYAADCDGRRVLEYAPNSTKLIRTLELPGVGCVASLALDSKNDLYVGFTLKVSMGWSQVRRYAPGSMRGVDLLPRKTVFLIGGIGIDKSGDLVVVNYGAIDVFKEPKKPPVRIINTGQQLPSSFAWSRDQSAMYVSSTYEGNARRLTGSGPKLANTVVEITYPAGKRLALLRFAQRGYGYPTGVAVFPPAPL
jgi:sugar lactone lactonase YvrE